MKKLTLNLAVSLIMEAVKSETLIKGRIDKAVDSKAAELAFNEEAGDEEFHERKLSRTMHTSLSRLMSKIGEYVDERQATGADNVYSVSESTDTITITLNVSDRFNGSMTEPLAKLCSKFIEDHMLYLWWGTFNVKQAEFYKTIWEIDLEDIKACFTKTAPIVPTVKYAEDGETDFILTQMGSTFPVPKGETFTLTYQLSDGVMDDIEAVSADASIVKVEGKRDKTFMFLAGKTAGTSLVTLYSKHTDVSHTITVVVS